MWDGMGGLDDDDDDDDKAWATVFCNPLSPFRSQDDVARTTKVKSPRGSISLVLSSLQTRPAGGKRAVREGEKGHGLYIPATWIDGGQSSFYLTNRKR